MGEKNVEPDAWKVWADSSWNDVKKDNTIVREFTYIPGHERKKKEALFSESTIKEIIQEMKEEMGEKPSGLDKLNRNSWKERLKTLEELQQVFNSK